MGKHKLKMVTSLITSVPPCVRLIPSFLGKFLPMKTMLGPKYDDKVPEENRFHPSMLSNYLKSLKVSNVHDVKNI